MSRWVLDLEEIDRTQVAVVGGKGAGLGELSRMGGVRVPPGFCVTTEAFRRALAATPAVGERLDRLDGVAADDGAAIRTASARIREAIEGATMPTELAAAITDALGDGAAFAVRSSAPAEDSATASFAGQHDSFLNVLGPESVLRHVRRCWASAFTDRAVSYRLRTGIAHRDAGMAVVVQRMVRPRAAGVLFTADPVTSNRTVSCVEAVPGVGDALVAGRVDADVFTVRDGRVATELIAEKRSVVRAASSGGTQTRRIEADRQERPTLNHEQVLCLADVGRRIEAHFGAPQDIEWCLDDGGVAIVQSRPITTLFPVPEANDDEPHVYVSVGHQQMMTDPMKPLGLSLFQLSALPRMHDAAGRLFVDVAPRLASPTSRAAVIRALGTSDPLIGDALRTIVDRGVIPTVPDDERPAGPPPDEPAAADAPDAFEAGPTVVAELIARGEASVAALERDLRGTTGTEAIDVILADLPELKRRLFDPQGMRVIVAAMDATTWLNERLEEWLGEHHAADVLTQSAPGNVTSEMGLALLDVADVIRPHPEVVAFLERVHDHEEDVLEGLDGLDGGPEAREAVLAWLHRYGVRGVGEIDITRPRWQERPSALVPLLLGNIRSFTAGESRRRFERGRRQAAEKEREVLERLRSLPDGDRKAADTKRTIDLVWTLIGYREYPKYGKVRRYAVYKRALMAEAELLARAGVLRDPDDAHFLTLQEFSDVVRTHDVDPGLIVRRRAAFASYGALTPPRVITSEGEVVVGAYRRDDVPAGALVGLAVSGGTVEGRARVVLDIADADLRPGDVLVTTYTDPSWSPVFVAAGALITEVGGLMTHGAVVAREYGLPAVVGVQDATRKIRDGGRVRVHGADGFVELLD